VEGGGGVGWVSNGSMIQPGVTFYVVGVLNPYLPCFIVTPAPEEIHLRYHIANNIDLLMWHIVATAFIGFYVVILYCILYTFIALIFHN
jgi:hypothetical protein